MDQNGPQPEVSQPSPEIQKAKIKVCSNVPSHKVPICKKSSMEIKNIVWSLSSMKSLLELSFNFFVLFPPSVLGTSLRVTASNNYHVRQTARRMFSLDHHHILWASTYTPKISQSQRRQDKSQFYISMFQCRDTFLPLV